MSQKYLIVFFIGFAIAPFLAQCQSGEGPYQLSLKLDIPLVATGLLFEGIGLIIGGEVEPLTLDEIENLDPMSVNAFDRGAISRYSTTAATVSDQIFNGSFGLPFLLLADKPIRKDYAIIGVMFLEMALWNGAASQTVTGLTQRIRPTTYNDLVPLDQKLSTNAKFSFFSGHTAVVASMTFFSAKIYSDFHPESSARYYLWGLAATIPAVTGILRYTAGKHFPSDIIAGYAIGAGLGFFIPHLHKKKNQAEAPSVDFDLQIAPGYAKASIKF